MTTEQFAILLETLLTLIQKGRRFSHAELEKLYKEILSKTNAVNGHSEWSVVIPQIIEEWKLEVVSP